MPGLQEFALNRILFQVQELVPIVVAGGKKLPEDEALTLAYRSIQDVYKRQAITLLRISVVTCSSITSLVAS